MKYMCKTNIVATARQKPNWNDESNINIIEETFSMTKMEIKMNLMMIIDFHILNLITKMKCWLEKQRCYIPTSCISQHTFCHEECEKRTRWTQLEQNHDFVFLGQRILPRLHSSVQNMNHLFWKKWQGTRKYLHILNYNIICKTPGRIRAHFFQVIMSC